MPNSDVSDPPSKRVLLVDDEPTILEMLADLLREAGYEVGTSRNGAEGLQKFRDGKWDVVITDRAMPELDGEELAQAIRELAPRVPVILMTGLPGTARDFKGFDAVLSKPFQRRHILTLLSDVLARVEPRAA